jgi:hypothetical protein
MDACLMATIEVAYELRKHVRAIAASAELVPGTSWPYSAILAALRAQPAIDGVTLATRIVDAYHARYAASPPTLNTGDVTKVALDLARIEPIATALVAFSTELRNNMGASWRALSAAQFATFERETRKRLRVSEKTKFGHHLWDAGSLAAELIAGAAPEAVRSAASELRAALQPGPGRAVTAEAHLGDWFDGTAGLTLYLAPPNLPQSKAYSKLALTKLSKWDETLMAYRRARGSV